MRRNSFDSCRFCQWVHRQDRQLSKPINWQKRAKFFPVGGKCFCLTENPYLFFPKGVVAHRKADRKSQVFLLVKMAENFQIYQFHTQAVTFQFSRFTCFWGNYIFRSTTKKMGRHFDSFLSDRLLSVFSTFSMCENKVKKVRTLNCHLWIEYEKVAGPCMFSVLLLLSLQSCSPLPHLEKETCQKSNWHIVLDRDVHSLIYIEQINIVNKMFKWVAWNMILKNGMQLETRWEV